MSRIGRKPVLVPESVNITITPDNFVKVKGPKGELEQKIARELSIEQTDNQITIDRPNNQNRNRSQHGLARTLIDNMVVGVTQGHTKTLAIQGVGYRAAMEGKDIVLSVGYSHPVRVDAVPGIIFELLADEKTRAQKIKVSGIDKCLVGQVAADIRKVRKPEPYKGKGIRYEGEVIKLKAGKRASAKK